MNRRLLLAFAVVLVSGNLVGQEPPSGSFITIGLPNGRFWQVLTYNEKVVYLTGFSNGLTLGAGAVSKQPATYYAKGFTLADHMKEIDRLYADTENVLIPIPAALAYCGAKLRGTHTNAELEQILINLRRNSAAPEEVKPDTPKGEK